MAKCWDKPLLTLIHFYTWTHKYKRIHSYLPNQYGGWDAWLATGGDTRNNPSCPETEIANLNLCGRPRRCLLARKPDCTDAFYRTLELLKDYWTKRKKKKSLLVCSPSLAEVLIADYVSITAFLWCLCVNTAQRKSGVAAPSIDKACLGGSIVY